MIHPKRYHSLDALRATMMLLGIVLHIVASYRISPLDAGWPLRSADSHKSLDFLLLWIHSFRMPAFFVVSGFFAGLLIEKRELRGFLKNRIDRIFKPFLVFWVPIFPLVLLGFFYSYHLTTGAAQSFLDILGLFFSGQAFSLMPLKIVQQPNTVHLWFLNFLLWFCGILAVSVIFLKKWPVNEKWEKLWKSLGNFKFWPIWFILTGAFACLTPKGVLHTSIGFLPDPTVFLPYFCYFLFGYLLWFNRISLGFTAKHWHLYLLLSFVAFFGLLKSLDLLMTGSPWGVPLSAFTNALTAWLLVVASFGLFTRFFDKESPIGKYLMDSSYFVYLIHVPIIAFLVGLVEDFPIGAWGKMGVIFLTTITISYSIYHFGVRGTFVGLFLNGRRFVKQKASLQDAEKLVNQPVGVNLSPLNKSR